MAKISTHNKRRARALRAKVLAEAAAYHYDRCTRLQAKGRLDDLRDSNYNRRWKRRNKIVSRKYKMLVLGTVTGRFSSHEPSFKELPHGSLTGRASSNPALCIQPVPSADYAEIEKRVLAHYRPNDEYANHAAAQWP